MWRPQTVPASSYKGGHPGKATKTRAGIPSLAAIQGNGYHRRCRQNPHVARTTTRSRQNLCRGGSRQKHLIRHKQHTKLQNRKSNTNPTTLKRRNQNKNKENRRGGRWAACRSAAEQRGEAVCLGRMVAVPTTLAQLHSLGRMGAVPTTLKPLLLMFLLGKNSLHVTMLEFCSLS